jgi:hypothetical protein
VGKQPRREGRDDGLMAIDEAAVELESEAEVTIKRSPLLMSYERVSGVPEGGKFIYETSSVFRQLQRHKRALSAVRWLLLTAKILVRLRSSESDCC